MCGIAGAFNLSRQRFDLTEDHLKKMQQRLNHRGPDQSTHLLLEQEGLGLAFTRLKIQDMSDAARQPMSDPEQTVTVCLNGEIYNVTSIRNELKQRGYEFTSTGDTQAVLFAYKEWGIDCIYKFEGMFALVIYDYTLKQLFLVRDRIGIKPLYFSLMGGVLSFASEIKALWELPWLTKEVSDVAAYHYLTFMVTPAPYTLYEGVYKLPAGMYLTIDVTKNMRFVEWYTPFAPLTNSERMAFHDERFCLENIRTLLIESTRLRMIADVPVGAFLSGGIDSSLNVALMSQFSSRIKTFTVAFEDGPETNELKWARLVAHQFNTEHHELVISEKEAFAFYETMLYHLDEPLADSVCIPFYYIAKLAREHDITVAQVGEGADELFVGYELYAQHKKAHDYLARPYNKLIPGKLKKIVSALWQKISTKNSHLDLLHKWARNQPLFWSGAIGFNEYQKQQFFSHNKHQFKPIHYDSIIEKIYPGLEQTYDSAAIMAYHQKKLVAAYPEYDIFQQMLYFELKHRLPELLLMRADKMSMAVGVEARVPFLDHRLVEFMMHVPAHLKFKNNIKKYLLKTIGQGILPDVILQRKKVGFATPLTTWFTSGTLFSPYFDALAKKQESSTFMPALKSIQPTTTTHTQPTTEPAQAVQKWVLQSIWAQK